MYIQKIILLVLISKFSDKKCFYNFGKKKCDEMSVSIKETFTCTGIWVYTKNTRVNVGMDNIKFMTNFQL